MHTMNGFILYMLALGTLSVRVYCQTANVTVALDGTGNFNSISAAVQAAPNDSHIPYAIYVKEGKYFESIYIGPEKTNFIIFGDGMNKTVITSNKSNSTHDSATMDISASNILVKDISIINSAGAAGGQAVALRVGGHNISCYRCSIEGYQDTLFIAFGTAQFFYDCNIYGTIDFIFGNAAAVIQNSYIHIRKPLEGQSNVITADGRRSKANNTAIVIHNCTITATPEFVPYKSTVKTYLGRPWKEYALTIFMESYLDDFIDPEGWLKFNGNFALTTLFYAEYANRGPGASTVGRVNWPGYHVRNSPQEVRDITVQNFTHGGDWLPQLGVPFIPGLLDRT